MCDTMAFVLRLEMRKMPKRIKVIFSEAEKGKAEILIPAIVLAELAYLSQKKRIDVGLNDAKNYIEKNDFVKESPLNLKIIEQSFNIDDIPELHDRLISGTGKEFKAPILTNDPDINISKHIASIWK